MVRYFIGHIYALPFVKGLKEVDMKYVLMIYQGTYAYVTWFGSLASVA